MRRNQLIMGTGVSLDIPKCRDEKIFTAVFKLLNDIDARFSPYKTDSELSKFQRGEIPTAKLSKQMKSAMKACEKFEKLTDGYFSAYFAGKFDPTGYVKGWAISQSAELIESRGYITYCIAVGGDILASSNSDKQWSIGLQDPQRKNHLSAQVLTKNLAVATSGTYERGNHLISPKTGRPADKLLSATVTGPDIVKADVFATAVFVMGAKGLSFIDKQNGYDAMVVDKNGKSSVTSRWQFWPY